MFMYYKHTLCDNIYRMYCSQHEILFEYYSFRLPGLDSPGF